MRTPHGMPAPVWLGASALAIALFLLLALGAPRAARGQTDGAWAPDIMSTTQDELPLGQPVACEWDWTIRLLAPYQSYEQGHAPRRMYVAASHQDTTSPRLLSSYTVGEKSSEGPDETSGALTISRLDPASGAWEVQETMHFPECRSMHGVAAAADGSRVAVLCRIPNTAEGYDHDAVAAHPSADWLTNENTCGNTDKMNDHMWLYEWPDGDLSKTPVKVIVHKSIGSWEYGQNYLRYAEEDNSYGIALKATVGSKESGGCHEADSFMILDATEYRFMNGRGWTWACATGHTIHNRPAYNPTSQKYAMLCSTDYSDEGFSDKVAIAFRREDQGKDTEIHYAGRYNALWLKGGAGPIVPRPGGGFLGVIVGELDPVGYRDTIPTQLGLVRFDAEGAQEGEIRWIGDDDGEAYYAWPQLAALGEDRYLLGWGSGLRVSEIPESVPERNKSLRIPWSYWLMEIDGEGNALTPAAEVEAGWGEVNEMIPLGEGRVAWTYVPDAARDAETGDLPPCNQDALVHYVYRSSELPPPLEPTPPVGPTPTLEPNEPGALLYLPAALVQRPGHGGGLE